MRLVFVSVLLMVAACSSLSPTGLSRRPAQSYSESDESVLRAQIPLRALKLGIQDLQKSEFIDEIYHIDMDPVTRILALGIKVRYPIKSLLNFDSDPGSLPDDIQKIDIEIAFPSSKSLTRSGYLKLQFKKFKINGKSYLNHFHVIFEVAQTFLANTDLIHYVYDRASDQLSGNDYRAMVKQVVENNGIVAFGTTRSIAFKINPKNFEQLKPYAYLPDLKIWVLSPFLLRGTREVFFRFEAGLGNPSTLWYQEFDQRVSSDNQTLEELRKESYLQYSNLADLRATLDSYLNSALAQERISESGLSPILKNSLNEFRSSLTEDARSVLSLSNESFKANPENEYIQYLDGQQGRIRNFIVDLDRRLSIEENLLLAGNPANKSRPFLTKKISQDLLSSGMSFLRDSTSYIQEIHTAIAPHIPGLILRGKINVPLEDFLGREELGLLGDRSEIKLQEVETGIPFEMAARIQLGDEGWLAIDPKYIRLFEGAKALRFDRNDSNDKFFLDLLKLSLAESLAALTIELDGDNGLSEEEAAKIKLRELEGYLNSIRRLYSGTDGNSDLIEGIAQAIDLDIRKNPFSTAGADYARKKTEILFGKLFHYDPKDKLFKIQLDPRIVAEDIGGAKNDIQVWGLSPIFVEENNNTYLELSIGKGRRGKKYTQDIFQRQNSRENADFSGLKNDNHRSSADLIATLNFDYLESMVNSLLKEISDKNNGNYLEQLEKDEEQTHYIVDSMKVDVVSAQTINLELNATVISKEYKGFLFWKDWRIDRESYGIQAKLSLDSRRLSDIKSELKEHEDKVFYNDQAIAVTVHSARVKFGKQSIINQALNAMAKVSLDGALGSRVRSFALGFLNSYFLKTYKESDKKILGHSMDTSARILTTDKEIIVLLNPRLAGAAFELKLASDRDFAADSIQFDKENQELTVLLTGSPAMAKVDKTEIFKLIKETNELISPYLQMGKWPLYHKLKKPDLVAATVFNNDESKMSLYNRLLGLMRKYDQILNTVNIPYKAPNSTKRLSAAGTELMYFAGASFALYERLNRLIEKVKDYGLEDHVMFFGKFLEAREKLKHDILTPLARTYRNGFHGRNSLIKNSRESYWNMNFFPDAYFGEAVYDLLRRQRLE